jgi:hypothetical protein
MITRRATWAAYGAAGVILLAGGFWSGKSVSSDTATPEVLSGTVRLVGPESDGFAVRLSRTNRVEQYALSDLTSWRDRYGSWHGGTRPACLTPLSHGQHITFGLVNAEPVGDAPGALSVVVWIECPRTPVPRFPIVTPQASGAS